MNIILKFSAHNSLNYPLPPPYKKSGHFFFSKPLGYGYDDGIQSAIQICNLLNVQEKPLAEIIKELPKTPPFE